MPDSALIAQVRDRDSCVHQKELPQMPVDEAYRFSYWQAFMPYRVKITITNTDGSSSLNYLLYKEASYNKPCSIISEVDKKLTQKNWSEFRDALYYADFWGLKEINGVDVLDGDELIIDGFKKANSYNQSKVNSISREMSKHISIGKPFRLLLKFAGDKAILPYYDND